MTGDRDDPISQSVEAADNAGKPDSARAATASDITVEPAADAAADETGRPEPAPRALRRPLLLTAAAALLLTVVIIGVMMARRQIDAAPPVAADKTAAPVAPDAQTLELPTLLGGEPVAPATTPAADKIFNSTSGTLKEGAAAIARGAPPDPAAINELPPPPTGDFGAGALQDAAKDAAKSFRAKPAEEDAIDLSSPDRQSALDSLERVAQSNSGDFAPPTPPGDEVAVVAAGLNRALELQIADLNNSLGAARQRTEQQESEIARLNAELQRLKSGGAPETRRGRAAVALATLAEKLRHGAPFRTELDAYAALTSNARLVDALGAHADQGLAALDDLKQRFAEPRDAAFDAARRAGASGPMERLAANFASLINLRPAAPRAGADAVSVLSRAEAALAADDLDAAVGELAALEPAIAAPLGPWIADARARIAAEAAIRSALADSGAALSSEPVY